MMHRPMLDNPGNQKRMRGFIAYVAVALWFLLAIMSARPAAANEADLTATNIMPEIRAALAENGMPSQADVKLAKPNQRISSAKVAHASYNPLSGRFIIRMESSGETILGVAHAMQAVPVLSRSLARGDTIADADITYQDAPVTRARMIIESADDLVGMTARRPLAAGEPIRRTDVEAPALIKKGAIVTLAYETDGLRMTHQGVAMRDGAKGDIVPVKNIDSDRTLKGVVTAENLVSIVPRKAAF
jgi:flagella basal body P-ring formation protein FlgA